MGRGGSSCVADARFYALRSNAGNLPPHGPLPPPTWITQWAPDNELQNVNVQRVMTLASATETAFLRARPVAAREEERRARAGWEKLRDAFDTAARDEEFKGAYMS